MLHKIVSYNGTVYYNFIYMCFILIKNKTTIQNTTLNKQKGSHVLILFIKNINRVQQICRKMWQVRLHLVHRDAITGAMIRNKIWVLRLDRQRNGKLERFVLCNLCTYICILFDLELERPRGYGIIIYKTGSSHF